MDAGQLAGVPVQELESAVPSPGGVDQDPGTAERLDVSQYGALADLQLGR